MKTLFNDLMTLCASNEAFYFVDHVFMGDTYRVFTYRLASYSDFLLPGALECRGHTFRLGETPELVSLPMEKFFNIGENPMTMNLDWEQVTYVEDKRDGSLISTVKVGASDFILKSKTSLSSQQARDAMALLGTDAYTGLRDALSELTMQGCTVNMEYTAPDNQIVLGYKEAALRVLNVRYLDNGTYVPLQATNIPPEYSMSRK